LLLVSLINQQRIKYRSKVDYCVVALLNLSGCKQLHLKPARCLLEKHFASTAYSSICMLPSKLNELAPGT
jgi:hypothetical protein